MKRFLLVVFLAFLLTPTPESIISVEHVFASEIEIREVSELEQLVHELAGKYLANEDRLKALISCEAEHTKEAKLGTQTLEVDGQIYNIVLESKNYNGTWSSDHGPLQVNNYYHEKVMKKMGLDINNWRESLEYGVWLYSKEGLKPWGASKKCWVEKINK